MQIQMLDYSWQKTHMHLLIASCLSKFWIFAQPWQCWSMKCALFAASVGKTSSKLLTARSPVSNGDKCSLTWRKKHFFTCQFMHFLTMRARDCGENEVQSCFEGASWTPDDGWLCKVLPAGGLCWFSWTEINLGKAFRKWTLAGAQSKLY